MPNFQIQGTLIQKNDTEQKSQSFSIREFVVEVPDGNYPQFLKFQLTQDRCEHLDSYKVGDGVEVHFDLRGKEYQGKYFTTLNAWKLVRKGEVSEAAFSGGAGNGSQVNSFVDNDGVPKPSDDLPF